ncbi:hypothetical protein Cni_G24567 [Canna indica]|uniref:Uncharacterized protein n=1 Tax=Canna indica TaxID=4628 RepID=A0AAQ3QK83_9LILI|nr:hypothetical protein Cni_G24567 [Canna indica]
MDTLTLHRKRPLSLDSEPSSSLKKRRFLFSPADLSPPEAALPFPNGSLDLVVHEDGGRSSSASPSGEDHTSTAALAEHSKRCRAVDPVSDLTAELPRPDKKPRASHFPPADPLPPAPPPVPAAPPLRRFPPFPRPVHAPQRILKVFGLGSLRTGL